jgi:hypothetical protein
MTRFVVDPSAVLHLASAGVEAPGAHKLLAPTLLRSQTLSALHEAVQRGEIPADVARDRLTRRCGRDERSSRLAGARPPSHQRRHHLQAVVGETPRRLAASRHEQPASTSATSARRPASPSRALR